MDITTFQEKFPYVYARYMSYPKYYTKTSRLLDDIKWAPTDEGFDFWCVMSNYVYFENKQFLEEAMEICPHLFKINLQLWL